MKHKGRKLLLNIIHVVANKIESLWRCSTFEVVVDYCANNITQVPLSFVLGFYVSLVMTRWWDQFQTIPYPDNMALLVSAGVKGNVSIY